MGSNDDYPYVNLFGSNFLSSFELNNFILNDSTGSSQPPEIILVHDDSSNNKNSISEIQNNNEEKNVLKKFKTNKKGRKRITDNNNFLKRKRKSHNKFAKDNIKRKVQVYFLKFLVKFVNKSILEILQKFNNNINYSKAKIKKLQFKLLDYDFAKKIDRASFNSLKSKSIKEIIIENTSPKIKKNNNKNIYNNIIKINEKINNILNKTYLEFFHIFYENINLVNLKQYDFDIEIPLNGIKKYKDFCDEQRNKTEDSELYIKKIEDCIHHNFLDSSD